VNCFAQKLPIPEAQKLSLVDYKFSDFSLNDDTTLCATARMFVDLDLINKFHIRYEVHVLESSTAFHREALNAEQSSHEKLSVCLSGKRVHCDKMEERHVPIFIPYERSVSLVFSEEEWLVGSTLLT